MCVGGSYCQVGWPGVVGGILDPVYKGLRTENGKGSSYHTDMKLVGGDIQRGDVGGGDMIPTPGPMNRVGKGPCKEVSRQVRTYVR